MNKKIFIILFLIFVGGGSISQAVMTTPSPVQSAILFLSNTWTQVQTFLGGISIGGDSTLSFTDDAIVTTEENTITYDKGVIYDLADVTTPGAGSGFTYQILASQHILNVIAYDTFAVVKMPVPETGQGYLIFNSIDTAISVSPNDSETFDGDADYTIPAGKLVHFVFNGTLWRKKYWTMQDAQTVVTTSSITPTNIQTNIFINGNSLSIGMPQSPIDAQPHIIKSLGTGNEISDGAANKLIDGNATVSIAENDTITVMWVEGLDTWKITSWFVDIP
ncbi:MAG: hypothetical protein KAS30_01470 [Candidatus Diapherotrites archaeon]|nr:hypothetical protein [Candidatus Diapherotrites archaeon]